MSLGCDSLRAGLWFPFDPDLPLKLRPVTLPTGSPWLLKNRECKTPRKGENHVTEGKRPGSHSHSIYSRQKLSVQFWDRLELKATICEPFKGHLEPITASSVQSSGEERTQRRGDSQDHGSPSTRVRVGCCLLPPVTEAPSWLHLTVPRRQGCREDTGTAECCLPCGSVCIYETATRRKTRLCSQEAPHL